MIVLEILISVVLVIMSVFMILLPIVVIPYNEIKLISPINKNKLILCSECDKLSRNYQNQMNGGRCVHCNSLIGILIQEDVKITKHLKEWAKDQPGFPQINLREWVRLKVTEIRLTRKNDNEEIQEIIDRHTKNPPSSGWIKKIVRRKRS